MNNRSSEKLLSLLSDNLKRETFIKLTLGNYQGTEANLQRLIVRLVNVKNKPHLAFLYRYQTKDITKNFDFARSIELVRELLGGEFYSAHLFTVEHDYQFEIKNGKSRLNVGKPTLKPQSDAAHNRQKQTLVDAKSLYLKELGVTTDKGEVRPTMQDKWRQINKFAEIVGGLFDESELRDKPEFSIVDMGSGKGYLTFAVYDYFNNTRKIKADVTGVETRAELVALCNRVAQSADFQNLRFETGFINNYELNQTDVLIALHACNTATDDAIYKGIRANASLIICSPCCHQEIRPQIKPPALLKNVLKHGILLEREAEIITDGLRALLLERSGYKTKVFEFISTEHTAKNNLIVGVRQKKAVDVETYNRQISEIKDFYGIREHRLEKLLDN